MALALKKYTLVPTAEGTLDPRYPDGNQAPSTPVLGTPTTISPIQIDIPLATPSTGGVAPLTYILERSTVSASTGFSEILFNAFSPVEDVHEDTALTPNTQYWYRCFSFDSNTTPRQSEYSNVVSEITDVDSGDITPPDITVTATTPYTGVTSTSFTIHWVAPADH